MGTTSTTSISDAPSQSFDWAKDLSMLKKNCCPVIVSARLNCFFKVPRSNLSQENELPDEIIKAYIEWKEVPTNENRDVQCNSCQGLTVIKRCKLAYSIDDTTEKNSRQMKLTAFPECFIEYFKNSGKTELKHYIKAFIECENIDIHFDKERIITKIVDHQDDLI